MRLRSVRCALLHGVALLRGRPCAPRNFARGSTFNASRLPRTRCRPCACPRIYTKTEGRTFLGCTHPRRAVRVCVRSFHVVAMPPSKRKTIGKSTGVHSMQAICGSLQNDACSIAFRIASHSRICRRAGYRWIASIGRRISMAPKKRSTSASAGWAKRRERDA